MKCARMLRTRMLRTRLNLLPAILLIAMAAGGCENDGENSEPIFTRVSASPDCGVVPLNVDFFAAVSGGNETGDPMGANNLLDVQWKFGDGTSGSTSVNYHTFATPGDYSVIVTATDQDGKNTSRTLSVTVLADSLVIEATSNFPAGSVTTADPIMFFLAAQSCNIEFPSVLGDSVKMTYRWQMGDAANTVYTGVNPIFSYSTAGDYTVELTVTSPALAVTRHVTLDFTVVDP